MPEESKRARCANTEPVGPTNAARDRDGTLYAGQLQRCRLLDFCQAAPTKATDMADLQVTCINKLNRTSSHEGITHLGGSWGKKTRQQVIADIEGKVNTYYTMVGGRRAVVGVVNGPNGKYVRTYADGVWNDNLLALPECG